VDFAEREVASRCSRTSVGGWIESFIPENPEQYLPDDCRAGYAAGR
jgi:hypothetical protein